MTQTNGEAVSRSTFVERGVPVCDGSCRLLCAAVAAGIMARCGAWVTTTSSAAGSNKRMQLTKRGFL